jgi:predicted NAD/FAD-dependent oxidoreductase
VFDLGALGGPPGLFAFVVSGARAWIEQGLEATADAVHRQAQQAFAAGTWHGPLLRVRSLSERRATFLCTPDLLRPAARVAPGLVAGGDYVDGPYPATLEGAVRSGLAAADAALGIQT